MSADNIRMTIQDIADAVGVSKTTVSRYLNGRYNYMSEETRRRIERVIRETEFRPNKAAGSLKTARTDLIGLVIPDASSMMTPHLISSICDECTANRRKTIVVSTHNDEDKERRLVKELIAHQVDGIITATGGNLALYRQIDESGIPVVQTDYLQGNSPLDVVLVDHYKGCERAANYLIDHGFRRIVFLIRSSKDGYGTFAPREEAVRTVCAARSSEGVWFEKILVEDSAFGDPNRFRWGLQKINMQHKDQPTAIFVGEGLLMGHVICAFSQMRLSFSSHFTISGYDDTRVAATCGAGHALVLNQPLIQMGTMATRILLGRIDQNMEFKEKVRCLLDCTMTIPKSFE